MWKHFRRLVAVVGIIGLLSSCDSTVDESKENSDQIEEQDADDVQKLSEAHGIDVSSLSMTRFGDEVGLTFQSPKYSSFATEGTLTIEGNVSRHEQLAEDYVWIQLISLANKDDVFNYYATFDESGNFEYDVKFHYGADEYEIDIYAPSDQVGEEGQFYEGASMTVLNVNDERQREIEYTPLGLENDLSFVAPLDGFLEADRSVVVQGTVNNERDDELLLIHVTYEQDQEEFLVPINNQSFEEEVPLQFGEGEHKITVLLDTGDDDLYYEAASFIVNRTTDESLISIDHFDQYYERGVTLEAPAVTDLLYYEGQEYEIEGTIDSTIVGSEDISHMIVTTEHESGVEAHYYVPVEDYQFKGMIYFRFGEGEYDVTVSVPDPYEEGENYFVFYGTSLFTHNVEGAEDLRSLLPSVGIESDDPVIISLANQLTDGIDNDRDRAKAIYDYVATTIAYDVDKLENNAFEMDDSAIKTLETRQGVCQDYAFLTIALLRALDMEANYVAGVTSTGERHAWVDVSVDGEWLEMDPTWGAGFIQDDEFHFQYNPDYFDPDSAFLSETHTREEIIY
ncbi:transglutaminase domain-containing protein [Geomicrobium sp. JCM 19038]|uniref:transglutaminase domain-containing protein n=1 Tax=Geomicrobium sp. JCM 19038 TaxID=1460635 RepID=UPI00045F2D67|nr:transglutaminase domain-containing protein [Geomicrobium sp. JCM 19038]GAK09832.1 transglutaminase-like enzyme [Geomicrobium sp. JCM 19038]